MLLTSLSKPSTVRWRGYIVGKQLHVAEGRHLELHNEPCSQYWWWNQRWLKPFQSGLLFEMNYSELSGGATAVLSNSTWNSTLAVSVSNTAFTVVQSLHSTHESTPIWQTCSYILGYRTLNLNFLALSWIRICIATHLGGDLYVDRSTIEFTDSSILKLV